MRNELVAVIPVRVGSTRIKRKNFQPFGEYKTLIHQKIDHLKRSGCINKIYVSSNNDEIRSIADECNVEYLEREDYYCSSEARWDEVVTHIVESIPGSPHILWAMVTSPLFIRYQDAINEYFLGLEEGYDSLIGVKKINEYLIDESGRPLFFAFGPWHPYTTEFKPMYAINDVVFIAPKDLQIKLRYWFGRNPKLLECDVIESIDVNFPDDLKLAIAANRIEE